MKKKSVLLATLILSASLAQSQTQPSPAPSPSVGTAVQPGVNPTQPRPGIAPRANTPSEDNRILLDRPPQPGFGGTNQVTFGTTNPPFGTPNQTAFQRTNLAPAFGTNQTAFPGAGAPINEASGASTNANTGLTNGTANAADQAFAQQLRAALARTGATQIFFPQTRSTVTVMNQNGAVTLRGMVANEGERRSIEARIKNTPGVTSVSNQLQIPTFVPGTLPGAETNRQLLNP